SCCRCLSSGDQMDAAARPLPSDETTPPVTKMYFTGRVLALCMVVRSGVRGTEAADAFQIFRGVHANRVVPRLDGFDANTMLERPELLERFRDFQGRLRQRRELQQR